MTNATGKFTTTSWEEAPYDQADDAPVIAKADVRNTFEGDIVGAGTLTYLLAYPKDYASFVGIQRVTGALGGKTGQFILQTEGVVDGGPPSSTWFVVPGSATGELVGLRGKGTVVALDATTAEYTLDYHFA
ncbi:DUF3224 domain-containing protein [Actinokineospora iranica]|uniref:DUF3224 domain-containing protein n=1 Tax=Actinokineospora iranica TaxID=1271860 RepID=A0A1G6W982_9PSEU|nr:DUF3224 domain-containing protein [Actinokineospora iranica]SDD62369.1 Protein of unknown function [Actinokineospora iranica]